MVEISIILPVYNAETFIEDAIKSILTQSFSKFELIIIDDGSFDRTWDIICKFKDQRIRKYKRHHNYIESLNWGLIHAKGKYIARMDADDIMHKERLQIQYNLMEEDHSIDVCGSWIVLFGESTISGKISGILNGYVEYPLIELLHANIIFHPTVMIRKAFLKKWGLKYSDAYPYAEDYYLWFQIAALGGCFYIESYPLLYYRVSNQQVSCKNKIEQQHSAEKIRLEVLSLLINKSGLAKSILNEYNKILNILLNKCFIDKSYYINSFYNLLKNNSNKIYDKD